MSQSIKKKKVSGSVKIDPVVHAEVKEFTDKMGYRISDYCTNAIKKQVLHDKQKNTEIVK